MRSKVLLAVTLSVVGFATVARAEMPVSLPQIAPHCRSLVKARFERKVGDHLEFRVERIYVGDVTYTLSVPAYHWREAWGKTKAGFAGYFAYSQNPEVDAVFPIKGDRVRAFYPGTVAEVEKGSLSWRPLAEIESQLTAMARRHRALVLMFSRSDELSGFQVIFTNRGKERMAVNRGGLLLYRVSDIKGNTLSDQRDPADGNLRADYVDLEPDESMVVEAPAGLLEDVKESQVKVTVRYTNTEEEPSLWYGTKETRPFIVAAPQTGSLLKSPLSSPPAEAVSSIVPRYTVLAGKAGVEGEVILSVDILSDGQIAAVSVVGEGLPLGLSLASVETLKKWRFEPAEAKRHQHIVVEFRVVGACDPEPREKRIGYHKLRVWEQREMQDWVRFVMTASKGGQTKCVPITDPAPECAR